MADLITADDYSIFQTEPAWHGKGIVVPAGQSISQQHLIDGFGYQVDKVPLVTVYGDTTTTFATMRTLANGKRIVLGDKLGSNYTPVQNTKLIEVITPLLEQGLTIETGGTLDEGRQVWILLEIPDVLRIGKQERLKRYVLVSNDHTGARKVMAGFIVIRVVCANTLHLAQHDGASKLFKFRHDKNAEIKLELAVNMMDVTNQTFLAYGQDLERLISFEITQADIDRLVKVVYFPTFDTHQAVATAAGATEKQKEKFADERDELVKMQNRINEIYQLEPSIVDAPDANGSLYGVLQAINFHLNHGVKTSEERRLESLAWGNGEKTDVRAFQQALAMVAAGR